MTKKSEIPYTTIRVPLPIREIIRERAHKEKTTMIAYVTKVVAADAGVKKA